MNAANKLILTTHSPFLINYLTLAVEAGKLQRKGLDKEQEKQLNDIVPAVATLQPDDLVIYELDENNGTLHELEQIDGLPSDENELNEQLDESNELFAQLLEIEQLTK